MVLLSLITLYENSRQYLPRKGTETNAQPTQTEWPPVIPDNIYPARGRKLKQAFEIDKLRNSRQYLPRKGTETLIPASDEAPFYVNSRQYLPRKGTETIITFTPTTHMVSQPFPTIFTPQGDGNKSVGIFLSFPDPCNSRQYLPRKGTETENSLIFRVPHLDDSRQYLPRKGTETHLTVIN